MLDLKEKAVSPYSRYFSSRSPCLPGGEGTMQLLCESFDILHGLDVGEKVKGKQLLEESVIEGKGKSGDFVTIQTPQQSLL